MENSTINAYVISDDEGNYMVDSDFGGEFDEGIHKDTLLFSSKEHAELEAHGLKVVSIEIPNSYKKTHFYIR